MHSFRQSRGRILFEVFCVLAVSASLVGAWMQTGATALLPAAAVSLLHALVHAFDLKASRPVSAAEPQPIDSATEEHGEVPVKLDAEASVTVPEEHVAISKVIEDAGQVEPVAPRAVRKAKAPRKGGRGRGSASKDAKVTEVAIPEEAMITGLASPEEPEVAVHVPDEEAAHLPLAPLFDPEPFARQQRAVFGRKAG